MSFINPGVICEITRPKLSGIGEHAGVFLPNGLVAHHDQGGPRIDTFETFAQGRDVTIVRKTEPRKQSEILGRLQSKMYHPLTYRLFDSNCEHFVSEVLGEKRESRQVNGLAVVGLIVAGFFAFRPA